MWAAIRASIGVAHWLVLRREFSHMGGWVAATLAGHAVIGLLPLLVSTWQPGWPEWAMTLIVNGKMHWLARVEPSWPAASWLPGTVTLTLFGSVLGTMQWLVMRSRIAHAGWWIPISTGGWALAAGLSAEPSLVVLASWLVLVAISGVGLVWLLHTSAPPNL